jgi:DNA-binding response OmpR family regulator
MNILIVEDDRNLVLAMTLRLNSEGHVVDAAPDVENAISIAHKSNPDIAFIDINIRGGDGFYVAQNLITCPDSNAIPFVFITGDLKSEYLQKIDLLGALGILEKPFDAAQVRKFISN